ncbi:MAG: hypothetical protein AAF623_17880, partial [Planctomycetota bacterium]
KFLVMGVDPPQVSWTTPMMTSDKVFKYLEDIQELPEKGPQRLVFFQNYLEDQEDVLAFDAYDEFARAPYEDLIGMKDQMDRNQLIDWIKDPDTSITRRRLYFTMLGVCGTTEEVPLLEELIKSGSRKKRAGLDALLACYLNLKGAEGVDLVESTFLADPEVDYVDTLAAVSALRFHGTEVDFVPTSRIVKAIRHLLDRPKMADMIIPDLARWKDWSVMERLVQMFKDADEESNWLRVPVITYLRACPKPEAAKYIEELRKIDPDAVERADFFLGFGESDDPWDEEDESTEDDRSTDDDESNGDAETDSSTQPSDPPKPETDRPSKRELDQFDDSQACNNEGGDTEGGPDDASELPQTLKDSAPPKFNNAQDFSPMSKPEVIDSNLEPTSFQSNSRSGSYVVPNESGNRVEVETQVASASLPSASIPRKKPAANLTMSIIFIPMGISAGIFVLLWSVVNGWFERLIF